MSEQKSLSRRLQRANSRTVRTTIVIGLASCAAALVVVAASGEAGNEREPDHNSSGLSAEVLGALEVPAMQAYGPRPREATRINVAGENWTLIPADDAGWCVDVGDVTLSCGRGSDIGTGDLAITQIAAPEGEAAEQLAKARRVAAGEKKPLPASTGDRPTQAVRRGIAPAGTWTVRSIDGGGRQIARAEVAANGAYVLPLGAEGRAATVEFSGADGRAVASVPAY